MTDSRKDAQRGHAAGGWPALVTSMRHALRQQAPLRLAASLLKLNQKGGVDCPGCAWPESDHRGPMEFCENGIKAVAWETTGRRVGPDFFATHRVSDLLGWTDHELEKQGRLTHPMRYRRDLDRYEPVTWKQAFHLIGQTLQAMSSPDRAIFYTSGRTSNEAAFLYQLFARLLGTNNLPDCSNMCHESSGVALTESIGIGKGTVTLEDFNLADAIFVIGQNPGTNHPRMLAQLQRCARRGCAIVAINPLREPGLLEFIHPQHPLEMLANRGVKLASLYLQPTIGGDMALLTGIAKVVLEAGDDALDRAFIHHHTSGFDEFRRQVCAQPWDRIEAESGLGSAEIISAAEVFLHSQRTIVCWAMGLTQHRDAVATIQMVVNLLLLRGQIGKPGAGVCPVRGHSNVQGDRTMGITEQPAEPFLQRLGDRFGFTPPRHHGCDAVGAIHAMAGGLADVFVSMGGNFARATPDSSHTETALRRCQLTVQVSTKLNRSHLVVGREAVILPCLSRTELDLQVEGQQMVSVEDSMSMIHASSGANTPASALLKSEPAIVAGMAKATFGSGLAQVDWDALIGNYDRIRDAIADVIPDLFHDYNARLRQPGGFYLGNSAAGRRWNTSTGKARFVWNRVEPIRLPAGTLRMMTIRSHDQYNTTVYDLNDRYRDIHGTRLVVLMNGRDIRDRGLCDGDRVDLVSDWGDGRSRRAEGFRVVEYDIPIGCCATYFPETNVLVAWDRYADRSRTPVSKLVPVRLERCCRADLPTT